MKFSELNSTSFSLSTLQPPDLANIKSAAERVLTNWPEVTPRAAEKDREKLARGVSDRLADDDWEDARLAEVLRTAAAVFDNDFRSRAEFKHLVDFYCDETRVSTRSTFLSALMTIYIRTYVPGTMRTKRLAEALRSARRRIGPKWGRLLEIAPHALDPDRAPDAIARLMIDMEDPWSELKDLGIDSPHGHGLMEHAHLAYLRRLEPAMDRPETIEHVLTWLKPKGHAPWSSIAARSIDALLRPWTEKPCPDDIRRRLGDALTAYYGDPRDTAARIWTSISVEQHELMMRWLNMPETGDTPGVG